LTPCEGDRYWLFSLTIDFVREEVETAAERVADVLKAMSAVQVALKPGKRR
jgi:hypothetical protein